MTLFTTRHYRVVADIIFEEHEYSPFKRAEMAIPFVKRFAVDNPLFNPVKFAKALKIPNVYCFDGVVDRVREGIE